MTNTFLQALEAKHRLCKCNKPWVLQSIKSKLIGVDLECANQARNSRLAVYKSTCGACGKPITHSVKFAGSNTVGIDNLKYLASLKLGRIASWDNIVISTDMIR